MVVSKKMPVLAGVLLSACLTPAPIEKAEQSDLEAIERLHRQDARAARDKDFDTLLTLLSDDIVFMPPGENFLRGLEAVKEKQQRYRDQLAGIEILDYRFEFEEVVLAGDYAFEWGANIGRVRTADGNEVEQRTKLLRILKRQPDGQWKVHRAMWNGVSAAGGNSDSTLRGAGIP